MKKINSDRSHRRILDRMTKFKKHNKSLDLSRLNLSKIPTEIENLTTMESLLLNDNQLKEIKGLDKLTKLSKMSRLF